VTQRTSRAGSVAAIARAPRRLLAGALLTVVVLALTLLTVTTTATSARALDDVGYVPAKGWTASGGVATTRLPGNAAALGEIRVTAPGQVVTTLSGGTMAQAYPALSALTPGCITDRRTVGIVYECGTFPVTVTLPRAVANPVLRVSLAGGARGIFGEQIPTASCVHGWPQATVRSVNGAAPTPADVSFLSTTHPAGGFTDNVVTLNQDDWQSRVCGDANAALVRLRFNGLVDTITFDLTIYQRLHKFVRTYDGGLAPVAGISIDVEVPRADLAMQKSGPTVVDADGAVTWDLAVVNNGPADSHGFVVRDAVPAEVTDAALVDAPAGCELRGRDLVCAQAPPSCTATQNPTVATWADLSCTQRTAPDVPALGRGQTSATITLRGTAPHAPGTVLTNTARVSGADVDLDTANNVATATSRVEAPTLTVRKELPERAAARDQFTVRAVDPGDAADPGDATVASVTTAGTATTASSTPVQVRRGETYTITEAVAPGSVSGLERYRASLTCVDDSTGAPIPAEPARSGWTFVPTENHPYTCTVTNTPAPAVTIRVAKVGESADGEVVRMAGSGFELLADDDGRAGDVLADPAAVETETGLFELADLPPGTYWLRETVAPEGFALLAQPVRFTVDADGVVSLTDPESNPQVTADGDLITVHDVPRYSLPEAGGAGPWALTVAGGLLLAAAATLTTVRARRVRRTTREESRNHA
jgi:uncharacterized repeat protein (TIGR01451 family)